MATGTDYDTRRAAEDAETSAGFVEQLAIGRNDAASASIDVEDNEPTELPDSSYLNFGFADESSTSVLTRQNDEFMCSRCFLIVHRRRFARTLGSKPICRDCS